MSNIATYQLRNYSGVISHFNERQLFVRDDEDTAEMLMHARIRSGDYFATLATELDKIAQELAAAHAPEAHELEPLVTELLYINKHYRITDK